MIHCLIMETRLRSHALVPTLTRVPGETMDVMAYDAYLRTVVGSVAKVIFGQPATTNLVLTGG